MREIGTLEILTLATDNSLSMGGRVTLRAFSESLFNFALNKTTLSFVCAHDLLDDACRLP